MITLILDKLNYLFIRSTIKYIVWDFDGTLYQSKKLGRDLYREFFNLARATNKKLSPVSFDLCTEKCGSWSVAVSKILNKSEGEILDMIDTKILKNKYIKKNPDIVNFIESTQNHYHHLILTNSTYMEVVSGLKKIGFDTSIYETGPFKKIFSRDNTFMIKPDNRIYKEILSFTKVSKFRHLFVGDSIAHDIKPAQSLGFKTLPIWEVSKCFY